MVTGICLLILGCWLVIENKQVAVYTGRARRHEYTEFSTSVARQNIAIIGIFFAVAGVAAFMFL